MSSILLMDILEEQSAFHFSGKVTIVDRGTQQFIGEVLFDNGKVSYFSFDGREGHKAIFEFFSRERTGQRFKTHIEPGIFRHEKGALFIRPIEISQWFESQIKLAVESTRLRPPSTRTLVIKIPSQEDSPILAGEEFDVLWDVATYPRVEDLYKKSEVLDHQLTINLVKLRKLGFIQVHGGGK